MNMCNGLGKINVHVAREEGAFQDYVGEWRSHNCALISKKKRCDSCIKLRKRIEQRATRLSKRPMLSRIRNASNPVDQMKLSIMRIKNRRQRQQKLRVKKTVQNLMIRLQEQREQIASIQDVTLDKKCVELNVPEAQKLSLKEIIAAANKKSTKGRRNTQEWVMLCMLMNIRSPGYYDFLRKNNILPLPCKRTIRGYFSLINTKCGFDEKFAELLKIHFASKTAQQRHGVLLLDEINLRKSVAVCSKNLTYVGLTDFGDDGPRSVDINKQATPGLVVMFQPLADVYTQPIAVLASKGPVKGDELEKIIVKAICYIEACGAKIHGIISDGAATNKKMRCLLGVRGSMDDSKTWFTHPLDDERKVFMFSDICHVIKNIRNRLENKKKLRLSSADGYILWKYFETLYKLDNNHPGNARVCPKITDRHIYLDNTSKMRVRLATQIFSNSVANGLSFYASHGCEGLRGCEQTVAFCKHINDMFDALNRKMPNQGLTPQCNDFEVLQNSLRWLNQWESAVQKKDIEADEFLTVETSQGLRISLQSTIDICQYMIEKYNFKYLLTGKINQDNLEKFFGTIRQYAGCNDHPNAPTFLQLYKVLSIYSAIKPPKYGNCTVSDSISAPTLVSLSEIKAIYGEKREGKSATYLQKIKQKLDEILQHSDWKADDIIASDSEHDYALSPVLDCIIYYVTGFVH